MGWGIYRQGTFWLGVVRCGKVGCGRARQARRGMVRYVRCGVVSLVWAWQAGSGEVGRVTARRVLVWFGKAGMEGHRVVRLDVVCYVIVGLGVSGFAWFGSVGLAWCGSSSYGVFRFVLAWQAGFGSSWFGTAG